MYPWLRGSAFRLQALFRDDNPLPGSPAVLPAIPTQTGHGKNFWTSPQLMRTLSYTNSPLEIVFSWIEERRQR
jgi:hypothetical protein